MNPSECACACGATNFETAGGPLFRIICHCTICQRFNDAPYADILVYPAKEVTLPPDEAVDFDTYRPPPNVQRGKCASCGQPAVEVFAAPLMPKLVMVPRSMFSSDQKVPQPAAHIFYDKRVSDADDEYPKHEGYIRSQLAFMKYLLVANRR